MRKYILTSLIGLMLSASASAVTIDFTVFSPGDQGTQTLITPEATFNALAAGNFFVGAAGQASEICALTAFFNCEADFNVIFNGLINNLTLVTLGSQSGDTVDISAFDMDGILLGTVTQAANGLVDMTAFSNVKSLFFDDMSTAAGMAYDAFTFDFVSVPEPSTIVLLGLSLVALGFSRRKKFA